MSPKEQRMRIEDGSHCDGARPSTDEARDEQRRRIQDGARLDERPEITENVQNEPRTDCCETTDQDHRGTVNKEYSVPCNSESSRDRAQRARTHRRRRTQAR